MQNESITGDPGKVKKSSLLFIFITVLIDLMGIAIIIPVIPILIEELTGQAINDAGFTGGILYSAFAVMQFLFAPLLGELSDRFGRRPVLFIALGGLGLDYIFQAFAPTLLWLFVGRILAGVCGASHTVAMAYVADVSTPENRAKNFGMIGAAFGMGFFLGPMLGGWCAEFGYQVPFLVAAGMALLNLLFGIFILPESLPKEKRRKMNWKNVIPGVSLASLAKYKTLGLLIAAFALVGLAGQVMPSVWTFYTMEAFGWGPKWVGISLGFIGLMVGLVQAMVTGWSVKKFGQKKVIMFGFILWTIGMFAIAQVGNQYILFIAMIPYIVGGIAQPTMQGFMSNSVGDSEQGNLQGALTSLMSLAAVFAPLIYTSIFQTYADRENPNYFPGAPFVAGGIILVAATMFAFFAIRSMGDEKSEPVIDGPELAE
ncbi:MAG: TCR/Tet family MFS transporter [Crocinitomicaceae bacterium]